MRTASQIADKRGASPRDMVGSALRDLRLSYRLSLDTVAQEIGITKNGLSHIELTGANASVITAIRLARFYGTTVEELFGPLADDEARP